MIRIELTTVMQRRPDEVFEYLANFDNLPEYEPWVETAARTSDGPIGVGSTRTHVRRMSGRRITAPIELVEYEQNRRLTIISGAGGRGASGQHR